jgi:hypothetical protein
LAGKFPLQQRRDLIRARYQPQVIRLTWRDLARPQTIITNLVRLGFLAAVVAVLIGAWVVAEAHLSEQLLGAPKSTSGLIDPTAGQNALTPENIEHQILAFSLRLRGEELTIPAGNNPRPRPFVIAPANRPALWPRAWPKKAL